MKKSLAVITMISVAGVVGLVGSTGAAEAKGVEYRAKLRDPQGRTVGVATFTVGNDVMHVEATLQPNSYVAPSAFHGFHIHANSDPANGEGCRADPAAPSSTWFVSADGHLSTTGQLHGEHNGDLPSPLVMADGTARIAFDTDRIDPQMLRDRAVVLHAKPDNFGSIPQGSGPTDYSPNSPAATDLTSRTGNASDRVACGLLRRSWSWR